VPRKKTNRTGSYLESIHNRFDQAMADARHIRGEIAEAAERRDRQRNDPVNRQPIPNGKRRSRVQ
jgi:hypothetical protein